MNLVIVESPAKARTIKQYLGKGFNVQASFGHVRDLPEKGLGVDIEKNFKPTYEILPKAKKRISELKKNLPGSKKVYLATDEDREGEAISWHLTYALDIKKEKIARIAFHEITKNAILNALKNPRKIDMNLVNAQQARRILDRLVGYKLSPFLWKKIRYGLSAGRVQSVAVRLIIEREREIEKFKPQEYWEIEAELAKEIGDKEHFIAKLYAKDDKRIPKLGIKNKKQVKKIVSDLEKQKFQITKITKKEVKKYSYPPFTTSTMQQAGVNRLRFSAKKTMMIAQQLYEGISLGKGRSVGLITYMRTDSTNLAKKATAQAKKVITKEFGENYALPTPRFYKTKSKSAQEAHEAIRPTSFERKPEDLKQYLGPDQFKLYKLIWQQALACQMKEAVADQVIVDIKAKNYTFRSIGSQIKFLGYLKIYEGEKLPISENVLPELSEKEILDLIKLAPLQHFTKPSARYTEATLVKTLEKEGIGRPSTYAPIMSTIQSRGYVKKEGRYFIPEEIGFVVNDLLVKHFPDIVDIKFTAQMEGDLDEIASGDKKWVPVISDFYTPFEDNLKKKEKQVSKKDFQEKTKKKCPKCGKSLVIKFGRFGKFLACEGYPECKYTEPLGEEKKIKKEYTKEKCEKCGAKMEIKHGKFGPFLACSNYPKCKNTKPIIKKIGVKCPKCKEGDIIERKSKKGRVFYGCSNYPKCNFALWNKPVGKICPKCKSLLVFAGKNKIKCSSKTCDYTKETSKNNL